MRNFLTSMLGSLAALVIFAFGGAMMAMGMMLFLISAASSGTSQSAVAVVEKGSYLVFDLSVNILDTPPQVTGADILGVLGDEDEPSVLQLRQLTRALRHAAKDDDIAGIMLHGQFAPDGYGTGYAALKELREALLEVKASGKMILAYMNFATVRELYITSVADDLVLDPYGELLVPGLASEPMYMAGAFEKFGIGVQVTRVGKYKSAIEPFTRRDMSPESREQLQKLLDVIWADLRTDIAASRKITPEDFQKLVDAEGLIRPQSALDAKIVDRLAYRDEVIDLLKKRTDRTGANEAFRQVSLSEYIEYSSKMDLEDGSQGKIAIVYAEGAIVEGKGQPGEIGGETFARELRRLRQDDDVKAILLRVNSPGGSATASEHIQREIRLAKKTKPVVVSMGAYAASGGYWISAYADHIFAEPTTITGSIGVFGVQFNIEKLAANLGLTFDRVKTGKFADAISPTRPKTDEELAIIQRTVDWIYEEFVGKVAEGRGLARERVHQIAQGRVWSGADAVGVGLVDEIGGLEAAIAYTAKKVGLPSDAAVVEFPRKKDFAELFAETLEGIKPASSRAKGLVDEVTTRLRVELQTLEQYNDSRGIYARLPVQIFSK